MNDKSVLHDSDESGRKKIKAHGMSFYLKLESRQIEHWWQETEKFAVFEVTRKNQLANF